MSPHHAWSYSSFVTTVRSTHRAIWVVRHPWSYMARLRGGRLCEGRGPMTLGPMSIGTYSMRISLFGPYQCQPYGVQSVWPQRSTRRRVVFTCPFDSHDGVLHCCCGVRAWLTRTDQNLASGGSRQLRQQCRRCSPSVPLSVSDFRLSGLV
jgi:hypothetical protein